MMWALGFTACGGTPAEEAGSAGDGSVTVPAAQCTPVFATESVQLLEAEHSVRAVPADRLVVEDLPAGIGMRGSLEKEARLELRFKHCFDLSRVPDVVFVMSGRNGPLNVALDSPSNLRAPEGTCVGEHCYSPRAPTFLEAPSTTESTNWSDFTNGSPAATGDPEHVLGFTWSVKGDPGDLVDLRITMLEATTLY